MNDVTLRFTDTAQGSDIYHIQIGKMETGSFCWSCIEKVSTAGLNRINCFVFVSTLPETISCLTPTKI
ncbi:hypothetical protein [Chryseobacterium angstadtii]|uniref:hypothetical protein n=1 Tax=Chryseobacterium angstadtii TaxID=558151 RepID=UPI000AC734E0|nr:hypothetical protein [Chryseobacterium angstadtii]